MIKEDYFKFKLNRKDTGEEEEKGVTVGNGQFMVLLPKSVNVQALCDKAKGTIPRFNENKLKTVLGQICFKSIKIGTNRISDKKCKMHTFNTNEHLEDVFAELSSKDLQKYVGKDYSKYTEFLIDEKIVYRRPYEVGSKSFRYGLSKPFRYQRLYFDVIENKVLSTAFPAKCNQTRVEKSEHYLISQFDRRKFSIDIDKAEKLMFNRYLSNATFPFKRVRGNFLNKDRMIYNIYHSSLKKVLKLMNGSGSFSRDVISYKKTYEKPILIPNNENGRMEYKKVKRKFKRTAYKTSGRFYTSFTGLPKEIRKIIKISSFSLIEVDIKNCIPYLLSNYLSNYSPTFTSQREHRLLPYLSTCICGKSLQTLYTREVENFKEYCMDGRIYEILMNDLKKSYTKKKWAELYLGHFAEDYNNTFKQDRSLSKKLFISMLFGKRCQFEIVQEVFRSQFPIIQDIIDTIKKNKGYASLAVELFRIEGDIIIDGVAKPLLKKHKSFPILTVHDCIATTESGKDIVVQKINEVFMKLYGNVPKLDFE